MSRCKKLIERFELLTEVNKDFNSLITKLMGIANDKELSRKDVDKFIKNRLKDSKFKIKKDYTQAELDSLVGDLIDIQF